MKVTLNKALKFRNKLTVALAATSIGTSSVVIRSSTPKEAEKSVKDASTKTIADMAQFMTDNTALYNLRSLIHQTNVSSGADAVINEMSAVQNMLASLKPDADVYYSHQSPTKTLEETQADIKYEAALAKAEKKPFRVTSRTVEMESVKEYKESYVKDATRLLSDLEEKRNGINHVTIVEIPDDVVKALRSRDII